MNSNGVVYIFSYLFYESSGLTVSVDGSKLTTNIDTFEDASIILNCSYTEEDGDEIVSDHAIYLRILDDNLAGFSKPGGIDPEYVTPVGEYLRNRSKLYNPTINSSSALIVIENVICEDEKPAFYFRIFYRNSGNFHTKDSAEVSLSLQKSALQPLDLPLISTTETLENDDIFLSCTADVGKSPGYVKWWRFRADKSISLISQSETLSDEAGTCIFITTFNTTYQVTREDIGAFFRCTSHNNITQDQGPEENPHYRDTDKINVLYPAMVTNINLVPDMSIYPVSTPTLRLTCLADGNPLPNNNDFKWTFQNTDSNTTEEIVSLSNSLTLSNLKESHSGTYFCSVTNSLNLTHSSNITIIVNGTIPEPPLQLHCHSSPCGALQTCVEGGRGYVCETNGMAAVGVVFIILTLLCVSASIGLVYYMRKLRNGLRVAHHAEKYNGQQTTSPTAEEDVNVDVTYAQIKKP